MGLRMGYCMMRYLEYDGIVESANQYHVCPLKTV